MLGIYAQYIDPATGFHVIELRGSNGVRHMVQIAIGHDACPACGAPYPKNSAGDIDPNTAIAKVSEELDRSHRNLLEYAKKHDLRVR